MTDEKDEKEIEEEENEIEIEESENEGESEDKPKERTFTQAQVNRMMAREKSQGRRSVYAELGIKYNDKAAIKSVKEFIESQKTEEQLKSEDAEKIADAENRALKAEIKAEAMMAGIQKQFVDDCTILVLARMDGEENADLNTIIGELKTKYPVWFTDEVSDEKKSDERTGKKGTGSAISERMKADGKNSSGIGARLAAQRNKGKSNKNSYWNN